MLNATPANGNEHADWVHLGFVIGAGVYHGVLGDPDLPRREPRESVEIAERVSRTILPRISRSPWLLRFHEASHPTIKSHLSELKTEVEQIREKKVSLFLFISGRCDEHGHIRLYQRGEVLHDDFLKPHLDALVNVSVLAVFHTTRPNLYLIDSHTRPSRYGAIYCRNESVRQYTIANHIKQILEAQSPISARAFCDHMSKQPGMIATPPSEDFNVF